MNYVVVWEVSAERGAMGDIHVWGHPRFGAVRSGGGGMASRHEGDNDARRLRVPEFSAEFLEFSLEYRTRHPII
jgi:hypothetical protein